jgi:NADH-quinone oxidoreductase subunit M
MSISYLFQTFPFLSAVTWLPLFGAVLLYLVPGLGNDRLARGFSLTVTLVTFVLSLVMMSAFDFMDPGFQFAEKRMWIESFGVHYALGVDGISIFLVLLSTFLMPIVVVASHSVESRVRDYLAAMLVLETAMIGTLVAVDLFLFYVFWELMLAPMYLIIGIWGGKRRIYASLKFVLYTFVGSVLMFVAIFYIVWKHHLQLGEAATPTFLLEALLNTNFTLTEQLWLFGAFALAFGIKVPLFPFHTWLPDAHVEAPTGGSVILAGVLLKMGIYGFFRFAYPLFPNAAEVYAPYLAALAVAGIIYGACVAWVQTDMKKLVAYSSVSHLGYCVLGLVAFTSISASGSIYQMLNHGVSTGALFLLVGVLYDRKHTRMIADYGGLAAKVPVFAFLFLVFTLSSIALPLTNGFIGEFLILTGSFQTFPVLTTLAVSGVVLGAVYMLTLYMKTMFGEIDEAKNGDLTDVRPIELATFAPLLILVFVMGIYPQPMLRAMQPSVDQFVKTTRERADRLRVAAENGDAVIGTRPSDMAHTVADVR